MIHDPRCRQLLAWVCSKEQYGLTSLFWHVQSSPELESWPHDVMGVWAWPWLWPQNHLSPGWASGSQLSPPSASTVFPRLHSRLHRSARTKHCPTWQCTPSPGHFRGTCQVAGCQLSPCFTQLGPPYHIWRAFLGGLATQGGGDLCVPVCFSIELLAWCTYMANDDRERKDQLGILRQHAKYIRTK